MNLIPVEGQKDLCRDLQTNAILNTNKQDYDAYISRRKNFENDRYKIKQLENEMSIIKDNLDEIKSLLKTITNESR